MAWVSGAVRAARARRGSGPPALRARRWWQAAFGLAASAGLGWLLTRNLDWDTLGRAIAGLSLPAVLLILGFLTAGWALRIVRWWWLLRVPEPALPLGACVGPFIVGMAVNNLLPYRAGDGVRVVGFRRQLRSPVALVAGTVLIERLLDVSVLVPLFFLGLLGVPAGAFPRAFTAAVAWLAGAGGAALLVILLFPSLLDRLLNRISAGGLGRWRRAARQGSAPGARFPAGRRLLQGLARHGGHLVEALRLLHSRARMVGLLGLSVAAWACEGAVFAATAAAVGAGGAAAAPWFAAAAGTLATVIPSTPGHIGTFDYFTAQALAAYGAAPAAAAAFALTVHAVLWTASTAAGLLWLLGFAGVSRYARSRAGPVSRK